VLPDRLKSIFRSPGVREESSSLFQGKSGREREIVTDRQSRGLDQFFSQIRDLSGLSILDMGGACQDNINFVTNLGHRITPQSILQSVDETFGGVTDVDQSNPGQIETFLKNNLDYEPESFDGVLLWDTLQYMAPALLGAVLERVYTITRPKSYLLAFFSSEELAQAAPAYNFRILDRNRMLLVQRGTRTPAQTFNNRSLERLFSQFESVKFFLTRESLREVIIRR
jgi:hypothetical protein